MGFRKNRHDEIIPAKPVAPVGISVPPPADVKFGLEPGSYSISDIPVELPAVEEPVAPSTLVVVEVSPEPPVEIVAVAPPRNALVELSEDIGEKTETTYDKTIDEQEKPVTAKSPKPSATNVVKAGKTPSTSASTGSTNKKKK